MEDSHIGRAPPKKKRVVVLGTGGTIANTTNDRLPIEAVLSDIRRSAPREIDELGVNLFSRDLFAKGSE